MREVAENTAILRARIQGKQPAEDDPWGRNKLQIRREGLQFGQAGPTFHRHCDRWDDFAVRFCRARVDYGVDDDQAGSVQCGRGGTEPPGDCLDGPRPPSNERYIVQGISTEDGGKVPASS